MFTVLYAFIEKKSIYKYTVQTRIIQGRTVHLNVQN